MTDASNPNLILTQHNFLHAEDAWLTFLDENKIEAAVDSMNRVNGPAVANSTRKLLKAAFLAGFDMGGGKMLETIMGDSQ